MSREPTYKVSALLQGTVLDHLRAGSALRALRVLRLPPDTTVMVGVNLPSKRQQRKDLVKIEGYELTQEEAAKVALISPDATLSIIREYDVVQKTELTLPVTFRGLIRCVNPSCIVHDERVPGLFQVEGRDPVSVHCEYCETSFAEEYFEFL